MSLFMRFPEEELDPEYEDNGTIVRNKQYLENELVGHRIVKAERLDHYDDKVSRTYQRRPPFALTLDNGKRVKLYETEDCCAHTYLDSFLINPELVDHAILGVDTTGKYSTWHIFADLGDIMQLNVNWSPGSPFYYMYGFDIVVEEIEE